MLRALGTPWPMIGSPQRAMWGRERREHTSGTIVVARHDHWLRRSAFYVRKGASEASPTVCELPNFGHDLTVRRSTLRDGEASAHIARHVRRYGATWRLNARAAGCAHRLRFLALCGDGERRTAGFLVYRERHGLALVANQPRNQLGSANCYQKWLERLGSLGIEEPTTGYRSEARRRIFHRLPFPYLLIWLNVIDDKAK